jgi:hypothetical protein
MEPRTGRLERMRVATPLINSNPLTAGSLFDWICGWTRFACIIDGRDRGILLYVL